MKDDAIRSAADVLGRLSVPGWAEVVPARLLTDLDAAVGAGDLVLRMLIARAGVESDLVSPLRRAVFPIEAGTDSHVRTIVQEIPLGTPAGDALMRSVVWDAHGVLLVVPRALITAPTPDDCDMIRTLRTWVRFLPRIVGPHRAIAVVDDATRGRPDYRRAWVRRQTRFRLGLGSEWRPEHVIDHVSRSATAGPASPDPTDLVSLHATMVEPYLTDPGRALRSSISRRLIEACAALTRHGDDVLRGRPVVGEETGGDRDPAVIHRSWLLAQALLPYLEDVSAAAALPLDPTSTDTPT